MPSSFAWNVVSASVTGTSHEKTGLPCQDSHAWRSLPGGILVAAVADGAGSASQAEKAAGIAAAVAADFAIEQFLEGVASLAEDLDDLIAASFQCAINTLYDQANSENLPVREFSTTLSLAIAGPGWLATGQIGDGAIVARLANGDLLAMTYPHRGEYAGETYFLTMPDALDEVQIRVIETEITALAMMTDGLTRLAFSMPEHTPHSQFFEPLLAFPATAQHAGPASEALANFLRSPRVTNRTDDDKTLILATCQFPLSDPPLP